MSEPAVPPQPPQWTSDYFRDASAGPSTGRGLIGHVRVIAILLIVQGVLELLFSFACISFFLLVTFVPHEELQNMRRLGLVALVVCIPAIVIGLLRIVAGIFNLRYRRRVLGIMALGLGLSLIFTAYCAPTAIAVAIYGLIVYLDEPVIAAFAMGDRGRTVAEINAAFLPSR
jgi:hypothetical protein